jgi:hypothetical protein
MLQKFPAVLDKRTEDDYVKNFDWVISSNLYLWICHYNDSRYNRVAVFEVDGPCPGLCES